jgi:hypothetical protein
MKITNEAYNDDQEVRRVGTGPDMPRLMGKGVFPMQTLLSVSGEFRGQYIKLPRAGFGSGFGEQSGMTCAILTMGQHMAMWRRMSILYTVPGTRMRCQADQNIGPPWPHSFHSPDNSRALARTRAHAAGIRPAIPAPFGIGGKTQRRRS